MDRTEFMRQVWRPNDTVEICIDGEVVKKRIISLCFTTQSVRVSIDKGNAQWVNCELIVSHQTITGNTDDAAIIEGLRTRLANANQEIEKLKFMVNEQQLKLQQSPDAGLKQLRKATNEMLSGIKQKKNAIEKSLDAVNRINDWLDKQGIIDDGTQNE